MTELRSCSDETLMAMVRDRDCELSFRQLFERWQTRIHRTCYRMTMNWQDAEDTTQEVFSRLYKSRHRYLTTARFSTFAWRIAINLCRDHAKQKLRRQQKETKAALKQQTTSNIGPNDVLSNDLSLAIEQLDHDQREILILRHYEDLKFREIAELLNIPIGTVSSRMTSATMQLSKALKQQGHLENRNDQKARS